MVCNNTPTHVFTNVVSMNKQNGITKIDDNIKAFRQCTTLVIDCVCVIGLLRLSQGGVLSTMDANVFWQPSISRSLSRAPTNTHTKTTTINTCANNMFFKTLILILV
jgi:hypothetical protein